MVIPSVGQLVGDIANDLECLQFLATHYWWDDDVRDS
jgi:hypothetical protein